MTTRIKCSRNSRNYPRQKEQRLRGIKRKTLVNIGRYMHTPASNSIAILY